MIAQLVGGESLPVALWRVKTNSVDKSRHSSFADVVHFLAHEAPFMQFCDSGAQSVVIVEIVATAGCG
jgi:hypothetical protein